MKLKKKFVGIMSCLMVGALCIFPLAGCGGNEETDSKAVVFDSYKLEPVDFGVELGDMDYITQTGYYNEALYYVLYDSPEFPDEYYEDLNKIEDDMARTYDTEDMESSDSEDDSAAGEAESGKKDNKSKNKSKDKDTDADSQDVSDDELVGDLDDIFGNDSNPDDTDKKDSNTGDSDSEASDSEASGDKDTMTYEEFEEKYKDYISASSTKLCKYDIKSGKTTELSKIEDESSSMNDFVIDNKGNIALLLASFDYDEEKQESTGKYIIEVYSSKGEKQKSIDVTKELGLDSEDMYVNKIKVLNDGSFVVSVGEKDLYLLDADGKKKKQVTLENYIESIAIDSQGELIASSYGEKGSIYVKVDMNKGKTGEKLEGITDKEAMASYTLCDGVGGFPLLLKDAQALYMYDMKSEKTQILKWMDCGMTGESVQSVVPLEDGRIFVVYTDGDSKTVAGYLVEGDSSKDSEKKIIKVMSAYGDTDIQKKIIEYNKTSDQYKVEFISFENDSDPAKGINNAITSGNIPDIIDISSIDYQNYVGKGILEDLTPYIQKDDTMNEEYFVDGLLDALKVDGKQYFIPGYFSVITLAGKESELKQYKDGWTMKDVIKYYNSKPEGTSLFAGDSRTSMLYSLVLHDMNAYIDWNTGKVKFDGKEFKDSLEFCNKFPKEEDVNYESIDSRYGYQKGEILLNTIYMSSYEDVQVNKALFDNDLMFVGYPRDNGVGTYISPMLAYGICSSSENKEAAWEILKMLMTPSDNDIYGNSVFSSSSENFEKMVKRVTATEAYTDEDGNRVEPNNSTYSVGTETEEYEIKITPAKEDEIQMLRDLIKEANGVYGYNSSTAEMVMEDCNAYFEGKKSLDETVKIIQDKMSKYVNENR